MSSKNQNGEVTATDLPVLLSKLKPFSEMFKENEIEDLLSKSGLDTSNGVDFEGFLRVNIFVIIIIFTLVLL